MLLVDERCVWWFWWFVGSIWCFVEFAVLRLLSLSLTVRFCSLVLVLCLWILVVLCWLLGGLDWLVLGICLVVVCFLFVWLWCLLWFGCLTFWVIDLGFDVSWRGLLR